MSHFPLVHPLIRKEKKRKKKKKNNNQKLKEMKMKRNIE